MTLIPPLLPRVFGALAVLRLIGFPICLLYATFTRHPAAYSSLPSRRQPPLWSTISTAMSIGYTAREVIPSK
jgi:hypothetical protein